MRIALVEGIVRMAGSPPLTARNGMPLSRPPPAETCAKTRKGVGGADNTCVGAGRTQRGYPMVERLAKGRRGDVPVPTATCVPLALICFTRCSSRMVMLTDTKAKKPSLHPHDTQDGH